MANAGQFQDATAELPASIASSGTTTAVIDLRGGTLVGIVVPAMTSSSISFKGMSNADDTPLDIYQADGTQVTATTPTSGSGRAIALDPATFSGWNFIQVVAASSEGAARSLTLVTRPV